MKSAQKRRNAGSSAHAICNTFERHYASDIGTYYIPRTASHNVGIVNRHS